MKRTPHIIILFLGIFFFYPLNTGFSQNPAPTPAPDGQYDAFGQNTSLLEKAKLKQRNLDRIRQSRIWHTQALRFLKENRLSDARQLFVKAVEVTEHPEMKGYLNGSDQPAPASEAGAPQAQGLEKAPVKTEREMALRAEDIYDSAVALYNEKKFVEAKIKFEAARLVLPDYKAVNSYLELIKLSSGKPASKPAIAREISNGPEVSEVLPGPKVFKESPARTDLPLKTLYAQAVKNYNGGQFEEARSKFLEVSGIDPQYKKTARFLATIDKDIERKNNEDLLRQRTKEADALYVQAKWFYQGNDFESAKEKFLKLDAFWPGYRDVAKYLSRVDNDIFRKNLKYQAAELQAQAEPVYEEALRFFNDRKFGEARAKFVEVHEIYPNYRETIAYLQRIDAQMRQQETQQQEILSVPEAPALKVDPVPVSGGGFSAVAIVPHEEKAAASSADPSTERQKKVLDLYKEAVKLMKSNKDSQAIDKLEEVEKLSPNYRSTRSYLETLKPRAKGNIVPPRAARRQASVRKEKPRVTASPGPKPDGKPQKTVPPASGEASPSSQEALYLEAVNLYKAGQYEQARKKFLEVQAAAPGYKSCAQYLELTRLATSSPQSVRMEGGEGPALKERADRSRELLRQVQSFSDDPSNSKSSRFLAKLDRIVDSLESEKSRLARDLERNQVRASQNLLKAKALEESVIVEEKKQADLQREQLRQADLAPVANDAAQRFADEKEARARQDEDRSTAVKDIADQTRQDEQETVKAKKREQELQARNLYKQAAQAYKVKNFDEAKGCLDELLKIVPGSRDGRLLLAKIERDESEIQLNMTEARERDLIVDLARKADAINSEISALTKGADPQTAERKFSDLEAIVSQIKSIKARMVARRDQWTARWKSWDVLKPRLKRDYPLQTPEQFTAELEGRTVKAQARVYFREGQQLFAARCYPEARAKFLDALKLDPDMKSALTYVNRINRVIDKKDYETQLDLNTKERRALEKQVAVRLSEAEEVAAERNEAFQERARLLTADGTGLFKIKRYREARIKFEELAQIGSSSQVVRANRYLALIDKEMQEEREREEKEKKVAQERYLKARRDKDRMLPQDKELLLSKDGGDAFTGDPRRSRELEISRLQELRQIEQDNTRERARMLAERRIQNVKNREIPFQPGPTRGLSSRRPVTAQKTVKPAESLPGKDLLSQPAVAGNADRDRASLDEQRKAVRRDFEAGVRRIYDQALSSYKQRRYDEARDGFSQTQDLIPGYRDSLAYIGKIDRIVAARAKNETRLAAASKNSFRAKIVSKDIRHNDVIESTASEELNERFKRALKSAPEPKKAVKAEAPDVSLMKKDIEEEKRALAAKQKAARRDFELGVDRIYSRAVAAYKQRRYAEARDAFDQVRDLIPGYKNTEGYLRKIEKISMARSFPGQQRPSLSNMSIREDVRSRKITETLDLFDPPEK
jgi:TolA-binding protein